MKRDSRFHIAVVPGDGIGPEIVGACLQVLDVLHERLGGIGFDFRHLEGGAAHFQKTGVAFSDESMAECKKADAVLFGAIGLPEVRYPDGTEISTQFDLRAEMDLYAGLRPIRSYPGLPLVLADKRAARIDLVLVREQTEGLLYSRGRGTVEEDRVAWETMMISRNGSRRVSEFAFRVAERRARNRRRPGRVTCVDKANVPRCDGLLSEGIRRGGGKSPGGQGRLCLRRCHGDEPGQVTLGFRRSGHRKCVRRHPFGSGGWTGWQPWSGAVGRHR
jgi:3-isopropylmalate dehydrogenase